MWKKSRLRLALCIALGALSGFISCPLNAQQAFTNGVARAGAGQIPLSGAELVPMDEAAQSFALSALQLEALGGPGGLRNFLIGSDFSQNLFQRGTSFTSFVNTTYVADRWAAWGGTGTGVTAARSTNGAKLPGGFLPVGLNVARTGAMAAKVCLGQEVASADAAKLAGHTVEFTTNVASDSGFSAAAYELAIVSGTGQDEGIQKLAFGFSSSGGGASAWTGQANVVDGTVTSSASAQRLSAVGSISSNVTEVGVVVCWTPTGSGSATDGIFVQGSQLVLNDFLVGSAGRVGVASGIQSSPYVAQSTAAEFTAQESFYQRINEPATASSSPGLIGVAATTTVCTLTMEIPIMRTAPTVSFGALSSATWSLRSNVFAALATPFLSTPLISNNALSLQATSATAMTAGSGCQLAGAGGGSWIALDSELN